MSKQFYNKNKQQRQKYVNTIEPCRMAIEIQPVNFPIEVNWKIG